MIAAANNELRSGMVWPKGFPDRCQRTPRPQKRYFPLTVWRILVADHLALWKMATKIKVESREFAVMVGR
jgi:hypothetical protein